MPLLIGVQGVDMAFRGHGDMNIFRVKSSLAFFLCYPFKESR